MRKNVFYIAILLFSALLVPARSFALDFELPGMTLEDLKESAGSVSVPMPEFASPAPPRADRAEISLKVKLTAKPRYVAAETSWRKIPDGMQRTAIFIDVEAGDPDISKITLELKDSGANGYNPGPGTLVRDSVNPRRWNYIPFREPKSEKHPQTVRIHIVPKFHGVVCGESVFVSVKPVFSHLTGVHAHNPGQNIHMPDDSDYNLAWQYARWKYNIDTSDLSSIKYDPNLHTLGMTNPGVFNIGRKCRLGPGAFNEENICASVLGHENVHGGQSILLFIGPAKYAEIPAHQWEIDNAERTGISESYLKECWDWLRYFKGEGPKPDY